jgi:hypothetical protein
MFFFEKRTGARFDWRDPEGTKVLCCFFPKKEVLALCRQPPTRKIAQPKPPRPQIQHNLARRIAPRDTCHAAARMRAGAA